MARLTGSKPTRIKAGRGVVAKLWKNSGKNGDWYNVTITRVYTDDAGEFHDSDNFSRDDLLQVAYAANKAFDFIVSQTGDDDGGVDE